MKIEELRGKKIVGHYDIDDIDEKDDLTPYFTISKIMNTDTTQRKYMQRLMMLHHAGFSAIGRTLF